MSDITQEEIAAKLVGEMDFGDRDLRACISTAIREAEARGEARARDEAIAWHLQHEKDWIEANGENSAHADACRDTIAWLRARRSRKPIEASETDGMVEGYNGA